ncbi:MAG: molecular chaperone DnaJ [Bryobacteraceae bacterium]|nr:molecular chaperone DnaJ [Bryobacteraceae bacterium]
MASQQDYYQTLGVGRTASADEIRKAYRRLARKHHPDLNPGDKAAEERFKKVQEAYDILSDPKKKQMFDQYGFYAENGFPGAGAGAAGPQAGGFDFGGFDFSDFLRSTQGGGAGGARPSPGTDESSGGFRDLFSQFFGGRGKSAQKSPERGSDLEYGLNVDFQQSLKGTQVRLTIQRSDQCPHCNGTGSQGGAQAVCPDCNGSGTVTQMAGAMKFSLSCPRCQGSGRTKNACLACHGDGRIPRPEQVEVRIPQGVRNGDRLRVAGKGNAGTMGAPAGDLYITVRVEPHPFFVREGDDIHIKVPVTVTEAGLGAKIEVPVVDGRALLKIPQGTRNGQKFRLREKGVFNARTNHQGDQIVEVYIESPNVNDERTRELLRELGRVQTEDPRSALWSKV